MPRSIPDRWIPYKACGSVIEGTRIICFKVPLRKTVQQGNSEIKEIWDINALLKTIPTLGAVIDLTNTEKYYNPKELKEAGVLHKKIYMPGRIIPPRDKVLEFMNAVDEFSGKDCESLIGVHCTHGLNRTGYMVCRYMRDRLGINAKEAIKKFEIARGYKIERDNYIADLLRKKPPPPDLGMKTDLKPISESDEEKMAYGSFVDDSSNYTKYGSRKYNGESWRNDCRYGEEDYNSGRYVRHPNYNNRYSSFGDGQGNSRNKIYGQNSSFNSDHSHHSDSDRSDSSYDFRHDY